MVHQQPNSSNRSISFLCSPEYHRTMWNSSPIAQAVCQLNGTILDVNAACGALLDRPMVEILGRNIWEIATNLDPKEPAKCQTDLEQTGLFVSTQEYLDKNQQSLSIRLSGVKIETLEADLILVSIEVINNFSKVESQLKQSLEELQLVLDAIPQYIFWKDRNSVYLGCNQKFAEVAGLQNAAEIIGKTDYDLPWKTEQSDWFRECDRRVMEANQPEYNIIEPQKQAVESERWLKTNKVPLNGLEENVLGILGTFEDITERVELEKQLKAQTETLESLVEKQTKKLITSQARYEILSSNVPGVIYQFKLNLDKSWSFPYISYGCQDLFGLKPSTITENADSLLSMIHPSDRHHFEQAIAASASSLQAKHWQGRVILASGETIWIQAASRPQKQADGSIIWDGLLMDVSDCQRAEQELQKSQQLLELVFNTLPQCIYWKDRNSNYLGCNQQFAIDVGLDYPEQIIGKNDFDLAWKQYAHLYQAEDELIMMGGTPKINQDRARISQDGKVSWLKTSKLALKNPEGETIGVFGSYEDISDRQLLLQQTEIAVNFLEEAIDAISDPIFIKDEEHHWVLLNNAFCQFIGLPREELIGKTDYDFFSQEEADIFWAKDELVMLTGEEDLNEEFFTDANGDRQSIVTKKNRFQDKSGKTFLVGIILQIKD